MSNLKKFVGDYAYSYIKNIQVDGEKLRKALVTPRNARNVFSELDEFQIKSICSEISANDTFGVVRETTQEEIIEDFNKAGYDTIIFDDKEKIAECEKYYASGERICTYNNLSGRMNQYHMLVAIKKDIDNIKRSEKPKRDDEYGTSILNIQIAKNGTHMSIKNRYNHTVDECDSTLNNNLDLLIPGLQSKVLGYYGIAFLNKSKSNYRNVVNINGIYLKYNAEVNNVYFGDFVLDNEHGVRFVDHSRYYVGSRNGTPYVLDFQDKKVVKLFNERYQTGEGSLLSRAMKENLLHSGNKENADELNVVFPDALKELLQCRRKALQYLAECYGYDFQKPFKVTGLLGKFTAKSIEKMTGDNNGMLLICKGANVECVALNNGCFNVDIQRHGYYYAIGNYHVKYDFEADRKSGSLGVFIIQQDEEYRRSPKGLPTKYYSNDGDEYDKSGYNLTKTRNQLQHRLIKYKADKKKKEVDVISYETDLKEIKEMFQTIKEKLVSRLSEAKTYEEFSDIKSVYYDFVWLSNDVERFEKKTIKKKFSSIKEASGIIVDIKEQFKKLTEKGLGE